MYSIIFNINGVLYVTMGKKVFIIANPCSGRGKGVKIAPKVKKLFEKNGAEVDLKYTRAKFDAVELAKNASADLIVCIGGDGTLNETISGLVNVGSNIPLGYIPLGSTNDFAKSMGLSFKWKRATLDIIEGAEKQIDVCRFNEKYFAYVAAHGIFAETSCSVNQKLKNVFGRFAYILFGIKEVFRKNNYPVKIEIDGKLIDDSYAFVGFGNTKSIGGILKFKDTIVQMSDGLFEVFLVKYPKNLWQLSRMFKSFYKSEWIAEGLELYHAKEVRVYNSEKLLWSLDGEKVVLEEDAIVSIVPNAVKIVVK